MHALNDNTSERPISGAVWMCSFACLALFMLPLIVTEFYFSLHAISCQHDSYFINLTTWLLVDASFQMFILVLFGIIMTIPSRDIFMFFLKPFQIGFVVSWTIVGTILFFKHLLQDSTCDDNIKILMWIRIIGGLISIGKLMIK